MIVIDHRPYTQLLNSLEKDPENQLDEEAVLSFLFDNLDNEDLAMERVEFGLQQINTVASVLTTTRVGLYRPDCTALHNVIREMAFQLWTELKSWGCYQDGRLVYSPVTQTSKLEPFRLSLQPLLLYSLPAPKRKLNEKW